MRNSSEVFFLEAMRNKSWANGDEGVVMPNLPKWKQITFEIGPYKLVDRWGRDPYTNKPSCTILITQWDVPEWIMWMGEGSYTQGTLPFLKEALMHNFKEDKFYGGRGPIRYECDSLTYINVCHGTFENFHGREFIFSNTIQGDKPLGYHAYWGKSLHAIE